MTVAFGVVTAVITAASARGLPDEKPGGRLVLETRVG